MSDRQTDRRTNRQRTDHRIGYRPKEKTLDRQLNREKRLQSLLSEDLEVSQCLTDTSALTKSLFTVLFFDNGPKEASLTKEIYLTDNDGND